MEVHAMRMRAIRSALASLVALVAVTALFVGPAAAVRFGTPDGNAHSYVGLMVAQDSDGDPLWRCSGTLLSDSVFLTAGSPAIRALAMSGATRTAIPSGTRTPSSPMTSAS
jgi:hypothetical protein